MTVYYLGKPIVLEQRSPDPDGYVECSWPNGKRYRHWPAQLHMTPWGVAATSPG